MFSSYMSELLIYNFFKLLKCVGDIEFGTLGMVKIYASLDMAPLYFAICVFPILTKFLQ